MLKHLPKTLFIAGCLLSAQALALNPTGTGRGTSEYLFVENNIDKEYFITPADLDPRFTGSNVWTRYGTNQRSLGYMGYVGWSDSNRYVDMWISNSPIDRPFVGIRCLISGNNCPSTGYIAPSLIDREGIYHARSGSGVNNGGYAFASFSPQAYEYFRNQTVGATDSLLFNYCYTSNSTNDYNISAGQRCRDMPSGGTWRQYTLNANKIGHITLNSTGAMAEIWVASDGSPSIGYGTDLCRIGIVSNTSGLICRMVSYNLRQSRRFDSSLDFRMVVDNNTLGFNPTASEIKYSANGTTWRNWSSSTDFRDMFTPDGNYIYVFLSTTFFRKTLQYGVNLTNRDDLFTFYFNNSNTPESGYYEFTPSNRIDIIPREYGISIRSVDGAANPTASGSIESEAPIEFEYYVTTSAIRQADTITAQVTGSSTTIRGRPYCVFTSADNVLRVPIPAYLSWINATGGEEMQRNSCSEAPVSLNNARWVRTPWNASTNEGYFYRTNLRLLFPLNDSRSRFSVEGHEWMGRVSASGEVRVTATWIGVNR